VNGNRSTEISMCSKKPSWSLFDSLLLGAILPFVGIAVIALIGAVINWLS
jgi:hypothetical protein